VAASEPTPRTPAPAIDPVFVWATPDKHDTIFYVEKSGDLPANRDDQWNYGDAFRGRQYFPNHRLVYVSPQTSDKWSRWYYAAPRVNQDAYNFSHTVADIGGNRFSAVQRAYVTLRSEYDPLAPTMGTPMPDVPEGKFTEEFILANRQEVPSGQQEIDSLFIAENLTYVKRVTITEIGVRQKTGKSEVDVTTLYYRGEVYLVVGGVDITIEQAVAGDGYWGAGSDGTFKSVNQLSENWYAVTARTFIDLETAYRRTSSKLRPSQFFCPQETSTDTVTTVTSEDPSPASASDQQEVVVEKVGLVETVTTTTQSGSPSTLEGTDFDERTGATFPVIQESVLKDEVETTAVDDAGQLVTYRAVDACQSIKETRTVASPEIREWDKIVNYEWPPVLTNFAFTFWRQVGGRLISLPDFTFKQGFSGPQVAHVRQWWQLASPTVVSPQQMIPEGCQFNSPLVKFEIPPCLHGEILGRCVIGVGDPDWYASDYSKIFPATNFLDWPDSIVWTESNPYQGGYIVTEYTLNRPA
jgi:hypothetical protein